MELLVSPGKKGESRLVRTKRSFYQNRRQKTWVRKYVRLILDSPTGDEPENYAAVLWTMFNGHFTKLILLLPLTMCAGELTKTQNSTSCHDVVNMIKPV